MNSTLSWTAVLNQNGGWRLGAHQGSLYYTAPDGRSRVEKMQGREKGERRKERVLREEGINKGRRRDSLRWATQNGRERGRGVERETRKGSGIERGMDG